MRSIFGMIVGLALAGCSVVAPLPPITPIGQPALDTTRSPVNFNAVVQRLEPVAERICRSRTSGTNCDFSIFIDSRAGQPPNAFQRLDDQGRPEIGFTTALIAQAFNNDELAFVLGHEAAHHISGHLSQTRETALAGAVLGGLLATIAGGSAADVDLAQNIGGTVGARTYSKDFELEADELGTLIAFRAGYDPVQGAQFFARIPDPGDQFLGTHPPNRDRIAIVRRTAAGLF
jgi:Zn-dependent protease with chaperone function